MRKAEVADVRLLAEVEELCSNREEAEQVVLDHLFQVLYVMQVQ